MKKKLTQTRKVVLACGGAKRVAQDLGVTQQSIYHWMQTDRVPPKRVNQMAKLYGVNRSDLRPDIFEEV